MRCIEAPNYSTEFKWRASAQAEAARRIQQAAIAPLADHERAALCIAKVSSRRQSFVDGARPPINGTMTLAAGQPAPAKRRDCKRHRGVQASAGNTLPQPPPWFLEPNLRWDVSIFCPEPI